MSGTYSRASFRYQKPKLIYLATLFAVFAVLLGAAGIFGVGATPAQAQERRFSIGMVVATIADTDLLEQPAADGPVLKALPVNSRAIVVGGPFNDGWYWLDINGGVQGGRGYVQQRFLVIVDANYKPIPSATSTPAPTNTRVPQKPTNTPVPPATATATTAPVATDTPEPAPTEDVSVPNKPGDYTGLWLGELTVGGNVRVGPGLDQRILKSWWAGRRVLLYEAATDSRGGVWYRVSDPPEEPMWVHSSLIRKVEPVKFEGPRFRGRWVNVNVSQQIVTGYQDGTPVKVTLASTGKAPNLTELGVWKIYWRLPKQDMKGGNKASGDYYDLKDVPYPQYFHNSGEALHGTYWHDDFGRAHSHGCVNLSTPMSEWFYTWDKVGTIVYAHN